MNAQVTEAWHRYHHLVQGYLHRRLDDPSLAEDLAQEVFLRLQRARPQLHTPGQVRAWLLRTAGNLLVDHFRARREHLPTVDELAAVTDPAGALRQLEPCIEPLMQRLPAAYRDALALDLEGLPQREIARREGISLSGAKSRVQRARQLLQRQFERCCDYIHDHDDALVGLRPRNGCKP